MLLAPAALLGAQRDPRGQPVLRLDRRVRRRRRGRRVARVPRAAAPADGRRARASSRLLRSGRACGVFDDDVAAARVPWSYVDRAHSRVYRLREAVVVAGGARGVAGRATTAASFADDAATAPRARCQVRVAAGPFAALALVTSLLNVRRPAARRGARHEHAKATAIATGVVVYCRLRVSPTRSATGRDRRSGTAPGRRIRLPPPPPRPRARQRALPRCARRREAPAAALAMHTRRSERRDRGLTALRSSDTPAARPWVCCVSRARPVRLPFAATRCTSLGRGPQRPAPRPESRPPGGRRRCRSARTAWPSRVTLASVSARAVCACAPASRPWFEQWFLMASSVRRRRFGARAQRAARLGGARRGGRGRRRRPEPAAAAAAARPPPPDSSAARRAAPAAA